MQALDGGGQGLFGNHIAAEFHRAGDIQVMGRVHRGHDDHIRPRIGDHLVKLRGEIGWAGGQVQPRLQLLVIPIHAHLTQITQRHQLGDIAIGRRQCFDIHPGARASPHDCIPFARSHVLILISQ